LERRTTGPRKAEGRRKGRVSANPHAAITGREVFAGTGPVGGQLASMRGSGRRLGEEQNSRAERGRRDGMRNSPRGCGANRRSLRAESVHANMSRGARSLANSGRGLSGQGIGAPNRALEAAVVLIAGRNGDRAGQTIDSVQERARAGGARPTLDATNVPLRTGIRGRLSATGERRPEVEASVHSAQGRVVRQSQGQKSKAHGQRVRRGASRESRLAAERRTRGAVSPRHSPDTRALRNLMVAQCGRASSLHSLSDPGASGFEILPAVLPTKRIVGTKADERSR